MQSAKKSALVTLLIFVGVLLVVGFFDLKISSAIYNQQSGFGKFFEAFGPLPGALIGAFSTAALIVTRPKENKVANIMSLIGFWALFVALAFVAAGIPFEYLGNKNMLVITIIAAIIAGVFLWLAYSVKPEQRAQLKKAAIIGLLTFLLTLAVVTLIKNFWGRPRFRSMEDPISEFKIWFIPQGLAAGEEFRSFPSGHSANAAIIVWISLIPTFVPCLKNKNVFFFVVGIIWTVLVMASRVVIGAHFASDVLAAACIAILCFFMACKEQTDKIKNDDRALE